MSNRLKTSLAIFFIVILSIATITIYKVISSTIDTVDYAKAGDKALFGDTVPSDDVVFLILRGQETKYVVAGEYSRAISSYQKVIEQNKNKVGAYQKIALIYEIKSRMQDAISILQRGADANPSSTEIQFQLGLLSEKMLDTDPTLRDKSITYFTEAAKNSKFKTIALYKSARLISGKADADNMKKAKDIFTSLGDFQPARYELLFNEIDTPDAAIPDLAVVTKLTASPDQEYLQKDYASWDDFAKTFLDQLNNVKTEISNKAKPVNIFNAKGYVAYKLNNCEFSTPYLTSAIIESEKEVFFPTARLVLGECYKRLQKFTEAKDIVVPVYDKIKDSLEARLILRQVYRGLNDLPNMKKMYQELVNLDGQNTSIRINYASESENTQDYQTAAQQYEWLGLNLTENSSVSGNKNTKYVYNSDFILKSYEIYVYKLKDYSAASKLLDDVKNSSVKTLLDSKIISSLQSWIKYMQSPTDKALQGSVLDLSKDQKDTNPLYFSAYIAKENGDKIVAKDAAIMAFDKDENGYIGPLAAEIVNQVDK